jgi:hypothetical protein
VRRHSPGMTASTYATGETIQPPTSRRRRPASGSSPIGVRAVIRAIVVGAAVAMVATGWPLPVGTTLVFGVAVLLWVLATMAGEEPGARP